MKNANKKLSYNEWLNKLGYEGENPWDSWANSVNGENGEVLSGWRLRNSNKPSRLPEKHSETAFMTNRAIDFIKETIVVLNNLVVNIKRILEIKS